MYHSNLVDEIPTTTQPPPSTSPPTASPPTTSPRGNIYRDRTGADSVSSMSDATVRLNRRNGATGPTRLYHCVIPDSSGVDQTLVVGIYTSRENSKLKL